MSVTPANVKGAQLRWRERTAIRFFDGESNPDFDEDREQYKLTSQIGHGTNDDDDAEGITSVRLEVDFARKDAQVKIDVEVLFRLDVIEVDTEFVRKYAIPYTLGFLRGAFTDTCRSIGLPGLMIPLMAIGPVPDSDVISVE